MLDTQSYGATLVRVAGELSDFGRVRSALMCGGGASTIGGQGLSTRHETGNGGSRGRKGSASGLPKFTNPVQIAVRSDAAPNAQRFASLAIARWEDLFQTLRRNAVQDLRQKLKDPWAVTASAGHSEEVERKYYLGRVRQSDLDQATGLGDDDGLRCAADRWPSHSPRKRNGTFSDWSGGSELDG